MTPHSVNVQLRVHFIIAIPNRQAARGRYSDAVYRDAGRGPPADPYTDPEAGLGGEGPGREEVFGRGRAADTRQRLGRVVSQIAIRN